MTELTWTGPNGAVLHAGAGRPWGVQELEGWRKLADVATSSVPRPGAHGSYPGGHYVRRRPIRATLVHRPWHGSLNAALDELEAATGVTENSTVPTPLEISQLGVTHRAWARCVDRDVPQGETWVSGLALGVVVEWDAADPFKYRLPGYSPIETEPSTPGEGGLEFPLEFPLAFGEQSQGGSVTVENTGNAPSWPVLELDGPGRGLAVIADDGRQLRFLNDYILAENETLRIDTGRKAVTLSGVTRSGKLLVRQWFAIPPRGPDGTPGSLTLSLTGSDMTNDTRLRVVEWYDTEV
jgi:hypothetical protein